MICLFFFKYSDDASKRGASRTEILAPVCEKKMDDVLKPLLPRLFFLFFQRSIGPPHQRAVRKPECGGL